MTEYDYSPEALDRYVRKQRTIAHWVQKTKQGPMRDPFTPATPAANTYPLENPERPSDDLRIHHRGLSYDGYPDRDLDRYGERDKERGIHDDKHKHKARSLHHTSRPPHRRHRSSSQSATLKSAPPPLPLPPHPWQMPYSQKPSPTPQYYPKLTSPRDSRHSSRSSSTTRLHSPNSYFPPQSSPKYPADTNHRYTQPVREGRVPDFTVSLSSSCSQSNFHCHHQNAPQYPHSAYQVQPPPTLFKRLIRGLTGGNKQNAQRIPRRKRSSSL